VLNKLRTPQDATPEPGPCPRWKRRSGTTPGRRLAWLGLTGVVAGAALMWTVRDGATLAAPPVFSGKRLLEAFSKKPKQPQEFIPAPVPPPAPPEPAAAGGSARRGQASPTARLGSLPAPAAMRVPTWDETLSFAKSLKTSADRVVAAAVTPGSKKPETAASGTSQPPTPNTQLNAPPGGKATAAFSVRPATSRRGTGPRPPETRRFARLKSQIADTLAAYQRRPLNTAENTPWEVMHGFIAFGIPTQLRLGGPGGDLVNAIGWMNMGGRCRGQVMLAAVGDRLVAQKGIGVQGHSAQYLAILAQCRVALNSPISVQSKSFTVASLVEEEKLACKVKTELTFALIGLAHYLPTDAEWTARDGQTWNLERLVAEEIEQPIRGAPCGGTHRLFGLAYGCQRRLRATGRLDGHYARADKYVRDYQHFALTKLQNPDGSFSTEWFKYPADREDDIDRKVQTTGHILEWLVSSLDQEAIYQPRVVAAVEFLATALARQPSREWKIGPMGHALHALTIYQERAWGTVLPGGIAAFHGPMKAADTAQMATKPGAGRASGGTPAADKPVRR